MRDSYSPATKVYGRTLPRVGNNVSFIMPMTPLKNKTPNRPSYSSVTKKEPSYSSITKKEPLKPQIPNIPKLRLTPIIRSKPERKTPKQISRALESHHTVGYRLKSRNPEHDPRYPQEHQLMVGPIPGDLGHDFTYTTLRNTFRSKGDVVYMFLHRVSYFLLINRLNTLLLPF